MFINCSLQRLVMGLLELVVPPEIAERNAENLIKALASFSIISPSNFSNGHDWASDGSMIPSSVGILDKKSVVGAIVGPKSLAMRIPGHNVSILQGEQTGLILGLILSLSDADSASKRLLTDHLNSVRLISDHKTAVSQVPRLRYMNGRSFYRWILSLCERNNIPIDYTPGHSKDASVETNLNNEADALATSSQRNVRNLLTLPTPTFHMNQYTYFHNLDGWIESNISSYVEMALVQDTALDLSNGHKNRMTTWLYSPEAPPEHPYNKSTSAYSAVVQLYARSGQLPTADTLYKRGKLPTDFCRLGCDEIESPHHLFVHCKHYQKWRDDATDEVLKKTKLKLETLLSNVEPSIHKNIMKYAKSLFLDDHSIWPLKVTQYYLGQVPNVNPVIEDIPDVTTLQRRRITSHVASDWHIAAVRLAGRIFGDVQKRMASAYCPRNPSRNP